MYDRQHLYLMKNQLKDLIQAAFPSANVEVSDETGNGFWIDVRLGAQSACVEYRDGRGFGVSDITAAVSYGEGHDMLVDAFEEVVEYLEKIFGSQKPA
jgi:hypothetical protein